MSNLNGQQFTQLPMFLPVDHLIDKFHKHDTYFSQADTSPRDQWEKPALENTLSNKRGESLRDRKLRQIEERKGSRTNQHESMVYDLEDAYRHGDLPPIDIGEGVIDNGHHRLALHEKRQKQTGVPVEVPVRWWG